MAHSWRILKGLPWRSQFLVSIKASYHSIIGAWKSSNELVWRNGHEELKGPTFLPEKEDPEKWICLPSSHRKLWLRLKSRSPIQSHPKAFLGKCSGKCAVMLGVILQCKTGGLSVLLINSLTPCLQLCSYQSMRLLPDSWSEMSFKSPSFSAHSPWWVPKNKVQSLWHWSCTWSKCRLSSRLHPVSWASLWILTDLAFLFRLQGFFLRLVQPLKQASQKAHLFFKALSG